MRKVLFIPFSVAAGLAAGFAAQKAFDRAWALIDDEEPPQPEERDAHLVKLVVALALQGAVFRVVKGLSDRGARSGFARMTGRWPGEEPDAG